MRKIHTPRSAIFVFAILLHTACNRENVPPTVQLVTPADGETFMLGEQVSIRAEAGDEDGSVAMLSIYIRGEEVERAEATSLVYNWSTGGLELGEHVLSALAEDDQGEYATDNIEVIIDTPGGFNPELTYGSLTDVDGNSYASIQIGEQVWMAENLRVTHYADGTPVPEVSGEAEWAALVPDPELQAYCWFDNLTANGDTAGALYNWAAAVRGGTGSDQVPSGIQGVCPDGWHLPSDGEWKILEMVLGMSQIDADSYEWRGSGEGAALKETGYSSWQMPNTGASNSSGFTAVPGGFRSTTGAFYSFHQYASFWTSTGEQSDEDLAWYRTLYFNTDQVYRQYNLKTQGFSVRCVKDQ